jgi:hypothetical protein
MVKPIKEPQRKIDADTKKRPYAARWRENADVWVWSYAQVAKALIFSPKQANHQQEMQIEALVEFVKKTHKMLA